MADGVPILEKNEAPILASPNEKPAIRKMPVKIDKVNLTGDYEGWWFVARLNPKMELFNMLMRGTYDGMVTVLSELTVGEWNFVDEDGQALPQPHKVRANYENWLNTPVDDRGDVPLSPPDLIGKLTIDLVIAMGSAVGNRVQEVPGN